MIGEEDPESAFIGVHLRFLVAVESDLTFARPPTESRNGAREPGGSVRAPREKETTMAKVRYEELLPHEIAARMDEAAIAWVPFGTLEWHGLHLALGNDAVKAHELMMRCAMEYGGVSVPPTYWAIGGMPHPYTCRIEPEVVSRLFLEIFRQLAHVGFRVIVAVTGHYGLEQYLELKRAAHRFMLSSSTVAYALPEYEVTFETGYGGDHAGKWETSILWALRPELVDLAQQPKDLAISLEGVGGEDPREHASRELGEKTVEEIVTRLGEAALRLLKETSPLDRSRFVQAAGLQVKVLDHMRRRPPEYNEACTELWQGNYRRSIELLSGLLK